MKKFTFSVMALATLLSVSASAGQLVKADNEVATNLCMVVANGNKAEIRNSIKASGLSKQFVAKNIQCNDIDMLFFVQQYGKNKDAVLDMLTPRSTRTSITDIAMNRVEK